MSHPLRTVVTFKSTAFNTSEPKDYFLNDCCFGDDVCRWLIQRLRASGIETADEPGQEDFGWYFTFRAVGMDHCFVVGYRPEKDDDGDWIGWVERHVGFLRSALGGRKRGIRPEAVQAIHDALASSAQIRQIRWHFEDDFKSGCEDKGTERP